MVTRAFNPSQGVLVPVERPARVFVPMADESKFEGATAESVARILRSAKESWQPWILSLRQGTTARVHFRNLIPGVRASLHPHGVAYAPDSDGTSDASMLAVGDPPYVYTWVADTPGTWPLHDHAAVVQNVGRGLFAAVVVQSPADEAVVERDYLLVLHDYDGAWLSSGATAAGAALGDGHAHSH